MIQFRVEGTPPSYNSAFKINYNFRQCYLSPEAQHFKKRVKFMIQPSKWTENCKFSLTIEYHKDWFYKNGKNRKEDLQNMDKLLIDAIFEQIGIDDSNLWELHETKIQDTVEHTMVTIREMDNGKSK